MAKRDWLFEVPQKEKQTKDSVPGLDHILQLRLSELSRRNIAIKIYSVVLGCEIWLCGNEDMAAQLMEDDPETTIYTVNEMRKLYKIQPSPEELITMHTTKMIFTGSKIVDSEPKGTRD